jgi:hypothetical protein
MYGFTALYGFTDPHVVAESGNAHVAICCAHLFRIACKAVRHVCPWGYSTSVLKLYTGMFHTSTKFRCNDELRYRALCSLQSLL